MRNTQQLFALGCLLSFSLTIGCNDSGNNEQTSEKGDTTAYHAFPLSNIDSSYSPCQDFYHFAIGGWLKNNPVPETESRWGSFNIVHEKNNKRLKGILEESKDNKDATKGSDLQLVGDFYTAALDTARADSLGLKPLQYLIDSIQDCKSIDELLSITIHLDKIGSGPFFNYSVGQDKKNSKKYITYLGSGGIALPDKSYYFPTTDKGKKVLTEYKAYVKNVLSIIGYQESNIDNKVQDVLDIETALAKSTLDRDKRRQAEITYNPVNTKNLKDFASNINWKLFFKESEIGDVDTAIVDHKPFFNTLSNLFVSNNLDKLKTYAAFEMVNDFSTYLGKDLRDAHFNFYGTTLSGVDKMKPKWKRALSSTNRHLGMVLGKLFVKKYFKPETKEKVNAMVDNMITVFRERIKELDWMSDSTKEKALTKLSKFNKKIGYPDEWKDHSMIKITKDHYLQDIINCNKWSYDQLVSRIGKPVDRKEWHMSPQTVNAYYSQSMNEVVFPAGILQPPFFDPKADDALNYGGIVAVIGHELTHGFDDQGRKYNGVGNYDKWWTKGDSSRFAAKTEQLVKQYSQYEVADSVHVNGNLTLGENIADLGGATIAFNALKLSLKGKPKPEPIDGFTWQQRFFLSWAQVWHTNAKKKLLILLTKTDSHSPPQFRVNGTLSNLDAFRKAWNCKVGDKMVRSDSTQVKIW